MPNFETTDLGTSKERAIVIPPEYVQDDPDFPTVKVIDDNGNKPNFDNAVQILDDRTTDSLTDETEVEATKFLGRAVFAPIEPATTDDEQHRRITWRKTKVTGIPLVARQWEDYKNKPPFFYHDPQSPFGDRRTDLIKRAAFVGLGSHLRERQVQDAQKSLDLHNVGVKARLPLAGRRVDKLYIFDEKENKNVLVDVEWFQKQGFEGEEIYQSDWGLSCPLTLEDVIDYVAENGQDNNNLAKLTAFCAALHELARNDSSKEYQALYAKWQDKLPNSMNEVADFIYDYCQALCQTCGQNYHAMYRNNLTHGVLHSQNISFFGEFCDNFTVKHGLLEIGLAPENSADISGLELSLKKLSYLLSQLYEDTATPKSNKSIEDELLKVIKESWSSYEEFCEENWQAEVGSALEKYGTRIKAQFERDGIEYSEDMVISEVKRRLGGKVWPFSDK